MTSIYNHSKQQHIISNKYASHYLPGPQEGSGGFYGSPHGFALGPPVFPPPARYSAVPPNYPPPVPQPYSKPKPYPGQYLNELGIKQFLLNVRLKLKVYP